MVAAIGGARPDGMTEPDVADGPGVCGHGWGAELDAGQKFWWMDWNRMIRDAITAMRTGEPALYDDGE